MDPVRDLREPLDGVEDDARGGVKEGGVLPGHDGAVLELDGGAAVYALVSLPFLLRFYGRLARRLHHDPVFLPDPELIHEELDPLDGLPAGEAQGVLAGIAEITPNRFLPGGLAHGPVVRDAETGAVHAHVRRGFVHRRAAHDPFQDSPQHGEGVHVAVVVDGDLPIGLLVEGIDEIEVADIGRGRLVGDVDRVFQRDVPDREGLEFGVSAPYAAPVFMVYLGQAGGHLAAAGARAGHDHQGAFRFYVLVGAVSLVAHHQVNVGGIALGVPVRVDLDVLPLQFVLEYARGRLVFEARDHHRADADAPVPEIVDELESVRVIGDAEIGPHLFPLDIAGVDAEYDVRAV